MISGEIGYYSLIFSVFFSLLLFINIYRDFKIINSQISIKIYYFSFFQLITIFTSFFCLIFSFISSDFSLVSVYQNSHTAKPLFYKISGTWGNHEGSILLWLFVLSLFSFCFLIQSKKTNKKYRLLTIFFQNIITLGFLIFIIKTSNPFAKLLPVPNEGLGLNPILQDPALAIHPPILYLGYVGSSIIFSSSLSAMILNFVSKTWAKSIKIWIFLSWIFLTLGIMLGSIWAYYELGWGGFWFWDPVENASLMPWLTLTALLHSIIVLEKRELFKSWNLILSIITFTLSMNGTFLVRSGILNSVHTFANDPQRGIYILSFLIFLSLIALIIFFFYQPKKEKEQYFSILSKETALVVNNWFLMFFLSAVLVGTVYPIFLEVITGNKISVGPPFYNFIIIPFMFPFLIFMAVGPKFGWIKEKEKIVTNQLVSLIFLSIFISLFIHYLLNKIQIQILLIFFAAFFLLLILLKEVFELIKKKKNFNISRIVSHFGFCLLVLSIGLNGLLSKEINTNLKIGDHITFQNYKLSFINVKIKNEKNYDAMIGNFSLIDNMGKKIFFNPELRIYSQPATITSEAHIKTSFLEDKFIVMSNIPGEDYYNIRFQIKPFMIWIWLSILLISLGGFLSISLKKN